MPVALSSVRGANGATNFRVHRTSCGCALDRTKSPAEVDERRAIEVQGRHGRTARGGAPLDTQEVCAANGDTVQKSFRDIAL